MNHNPLHEVCCANLPAAALPVLAAVRHVPHVRVRSLEDRVWVWWDPGDDQVLRQVLAAPGVELYERRGELWYPYGQALPAFDVPAEQGTQPLFQALTPAPVQPAGGTPAPLPRAALRLVRDDQPRATTALLVEAAALTTWADAVPAAALAALSAARCENRVLLCGRGLPLLPGGERFWGQRLLVPLGLRPEPALPERALREALGVTEQELALCSAAGIEIVPLDAFEPLTRAGVRLAKQPS